MIRVVAGILRRDQRLLICQRHHSDRFPLKWEFPGGKLLPGEPPEQALMRELKEELGIEVEVGPLIETTRHAYRVTEFPQGAASAGSSGEFEISFFAVRSFLGEIQNLAFEAVVWVEPKELLKYDFLEADLGVVRKIASGSTKV